MPSKVYVLKLTQDERAELQRVTKQNRVARWKAQRAQALLTCDQSPAGPSWTDDRVAVAVGCSRRSVETWRKQAVEQGPLSLLERRGRPPRVPKLDGENEAQLVKLACSQPPDGRDRWTLRLLAEQLVVLEVVESVSHETVRRAMKKTS